MSSKAINYDSFLNAIGKQCKLKTNAFLSNTQQEKVKAFLSAIYPATNGKAAITINRAIQILRVLNPNLIVYIDGDGSQILSENTTKTLFSFMDFKLFSTLKTLFGNRQIVNSTRYSLNNTTSNISELYCIEPGGVTITGKLFGGGGGGEGAIACDNGKVNVTLISGAGGSGGASYIYMNNGLAYTAAGGSGAPATTFTHEGNGPFSHNGSTGNNSSAVNVSLGVSNTTKLSFIFGRGGNGGGGLAVKSNNVGTWSGQDGSRPNIGGAGRGCNDLISEDMVYAGGGAGGAGEPYGAGGAGLRIGNNPASAGLGSQDNTTNLAGGTSDSSYGGTGGYTDRPSLSYRTQKQSGMNVDSNSIGGGGYGGYAAYSDDNWVSAGGGNGGNRGGFVCEDNYLVFIPPTN